MTRLEDLQPTAAVRGILPDQTVTVVSVQWFGSAALELTYKGPSGRVANELLYRHDEPRLQVVEHGRPWSFDGDGHLFRLVSEAHRIRLAHLFDPVLAVHTSLVEPLPHQITAVYEAMLPRQPLRFLLADDPGAGKTIMAGLLIKELIARGDLQRCLVVCPGSLAEQWQDELYRRFQLSFEILTNDKLEAARTGNWFLENNLVIARLDKLSRNEDVQFKLQVPECRWDLVVCDEAHKLSATFFGGEVKYTKRYHLGQLLSGLTRHFLLMTATPHNGKEEDFQLFMALLDGDRFEGRFRDGVHQADTSDLMRRMVKENLLKFDGTPLFPERIAYTVPYKLSDAEARLYREVTDYVREEFNRAEALANDKRAGTVGFALTILQRRLASSPEAIYQSLHRRSERLQKRLRELEVLQRGAAAEAIAATTPTLDDEDVEDLEEAPDNEVEAIEAEILDQATAARTIDELKAEIATLGRLESLANAVRRSGEDRKWRELASLLGEIFTTTPIPNDTRGEASSIPPPKPSPRQKLVIFTEHRDTLSYLETRVTTLLGRKDAVVVIHGGLGREDRMKAQESFRHDPEVQVLIATDAAGEGINLQRAHLMVNYDLPWNPNRIEQRFGRIHRQDALAERASKKLRNDESLVINFAASRLRMELDRVPLWRGNHVAIRQLVEDFGRYLYLPRLQTGTVLLNSIRAGLALLTWEHDAFAYAESYDESAARYRGLHSGAQVNVIGDDTSLLVKPEIAHRQIDQETAPPTAVDADTPTSPAPGSPTLAVQPTGPAPPAKPKRYHGTVTLDPARVGRDAGRIADEVVTHLVGLVGSTVRVTLEIEAEIPAGASDNVVRTVTENSRTLKFAGNSGFEAE